MTETESKAQVIALMGCFNQLGRLLSAPDDFHTSDAAAIAETKLVITEMNKTKAGPDTLLERAVAAHQRP
jgi:hypothetical protein